MKGKTLTLNIIVGLALLLSSMPAAMARQPGKRFRMVAANQHGNKGKMKKVYDRKLGRQRQFKDSVIVKFKPNTRVSAMKRYMLRNNLKPRVKLGKRAYACDVITSTDDNAENIMTLLDTQGIPESQEVSEEEDIVDDVDIDEYKAVTQNSIRGNKLGRYQWHLENDGRNGFRPNADINVESAWGFTKGAGVRVAVIDTGFDLRHKDINYASDSYDVIDEKPDASAPLRSSENHGTAVAGIIAAKDNRIGVVGVAPEAQIIAIRLITDDGMISSSQIIEAHRKAVELGATIINNSWGSYDPTLPSGQLLTIPSIERDLYQEMAEESNDGKGVVVVFASGNSGKSNFNNSPEARESYNFAVGATDSTDQRASYSVYGPELDLVAPGGGAQGIVTTDRNDFTIKRAGKAHKYLAGYSRGAFNRSFRGTSAAAPVVAGVAALVWAANPDLTADEVKEILRNSANKSINSRYTFNGEGRNNEVGYGRVDAAAAVEMARSY